MEDDILSRVGWIPLLWSAILRNVGLDADAPVDQYLRGRLCVVGPAATHDEWLRPRPQPALENLPKSRVVSIEASGDVLAAVRHACGGEPSAVVDGPVGLCTELVEGANARLLHLVNYCEGQTLRQVTARLRVPPGRRVKAVTLAGPDRAGDLLLPYELHGDTVTFTLPEIGVYGVAVVKM